MRGRDQAIDETIDQVDWQPPQSSTSRRHLYQQGRGRLRQPRSHNGCVTCKRRKVRCDEGKPRCGHCNRLSLRCEWRDPRSARQSRVGSQPSPEFQPEPEYPETDSQRPLLGADDASAADVSSGSGTNVPFQFPSNFETPSPLTELFGFASSIVDPANDLSLFRDATSQLDFHTFLSSPGLPIYPADPNQTDCAPALTSEWPSAMLERQGSEGMEMTAPPPILEMVENGPRWTSARALLGTMATASPMVRHSVMAFVALQLQRSESRQVDHSTFYNKAERELVSRTTELSEDRRLRDDDLKYVLTTIFLLAYIDLLTDGVHLAQPHLKLAYKAVQWADKRSLGPVERRLISWIRLLDARVASAGGEGCFVNDQSGVYSPGDSQTGCTNADSSIPEPDAPSTEEVLHDMLCGPGSLFFQEVQSITGRITKIDHYHRNRGTVQDETEVMATAAEIQRDLARLYDQRPPLMDHAVAGNVGDSLSCLLAPSLAKAIISSYRTYLASFHGCYIHIHRIAHRHLPRPKALIKSLAIVKELMHAMAASCETLPVNVLWPLFLWGCEEDDPDECRWIVDTIRSLGRVTTNAQITADLLHEVQTRQQGCKGRVDVRTVTVELFKANFAIV